MESENILLHTLMMVLISLTLLVSDQSLRYVAGLFGITISVTLLIWFKIKGVI